MGKTSPKDIQAAFERLVDQFGLDRVTMKELAREVGISVGAIYLHFKSKDDLIVAYEQRWSQQVKLWNADIIASDRRPTEKLHDMLLDHVRTFSRLIHEKRGVYELLMGAHQLRYMGRTTGDARREMFATFAANATEIMTEGCESGDFEIEDIPSTARHFVGAFFLYFTPEVMAQHPPDQLIKGAEGLFKLLLRAIQAK